MKKYILKDIPKEVDIIGNFSEDSFITISDLLLEKLKNNKASLVITNLKATQDKPTFEIIINFFIGKIKVMVGSNGKIDIGKLGNVFFLITIGHNSSLKIGDKTTANQCRIVCSNSDIEIGEDCLISDGVLVQGLDQHGIIDMKTLKIINNQRRFIKVNKYVWLGRNTTIVPNTTIEEGSIIGAGSVVSKKIEPFSLAVGVPAIVKKNNISWCRYWKDIDKDSINFFQNSFL